MRVHKQIFSKPLLQLFVILLFTLLVYLPILPNEFVWDDVQFFREWKTIQNFNQIPKLLLGDTPLEHTGVYRPVRSILYVLSYAINKDNPTGYRIQAIILHLLGTTLVYFITKKLTHTLPPASCHLLPFLTSLFFGLHPIHTENVAFATASFDLFGIVFSLISVYFFMQTPHNRQSASWRTTYNLLISLFFATLAFFTTELTLSLPLLLLFLRCWQSRTLFRSILTVLPFFLIAGIYLYIRLSIIPTTARASFIGGSLPLTMQITTEAFLRYLQMLFVPIGLSVAPQFAHGLTTETVKEASTHPLFFLSWYPLFALILLLLMLFLVWYCRKNKPIVSLAIVWFLVSLSPVSNIIPTGTLYAERYLYSASIGFCLLLGYCCMQLFAYRKYNPLTICCIVILCTSWSLFTGIRNRQWQSDLSLWQSAVAVAPQNPSVLTNLGLAYKNLGNNTEALTWYQKALAASPTFARAYNNIGVVYVDQGNGEKALASFLKAHELAQTNPTFAANVAEMYLKQNEFTKARDLLLLATSASPKNPNLWFSLGNVFIRTNQPQQAIDAFTTSLEHDPSNPKTNNNLSAVLISIKDYNRAINILNKAISYENNDPDLYFSLATAYELTNKFTQAKDAYVQVLKLAPDFTPARLRLQKLP